jgi:putative tributyrin esterase
MKRLLLVLAACSSSQTQPAPKPAPLPEAKPAAVVEAKKSRVETQKLDSAALGVTKEYVVYLPASYDGTKRFPVFYYLHGLTGNEQNWVEGGKLDKTADELGLEAIVVMPDGDDGFYTDSAAPIDYDACRKDGTGLFMPAFQSKIPTCVKQRKYETYIVKDLIADVDAKYKTIATREGRAIAGLSMGGFGALKLSMRHPDLFAAAASHSGVDSLLYAGPYPYAKGKVELVKDAKDWGRGAGEIGAWMRMLFGDSLENWKAHDPTTLAAKVEPGKPALYLDCGTEDGFGLHNGAQYLHDILVDRKIEHVFFLGPGQHDFKFWRARLPESLKFLRDHTAKPQ